MTGLGVTGSVSAAAGCTPVVASTLSHRKGHSRPSTKLGLGIYSSHTPGCSPFRCFAPSGKGGCRRSVQIPSSRIAPQSRCLHESARCGQKVAGLRGCTRNQLRRLHGHLDPSGSGAADFRTPFWRLGPRGGCSPYAPRKCQATSRLPESACPPLAQGPLLGPGLQHRPRPISYAYSPEVSRPRMPYA
jgi:hypothetical protein